MNSTGSTKIGEGHSKSNLMQSQWEKMDYKTMVVLLLLLLFMDCFSDDASGDWACVWCHYDAREQGSYSQRLELILRRFSLEFILRLFSKCTKRFGSSFHAVFSCS